MRKITRSILILLLILTLNLSVIHAVSRASRYISQFLIICDSGNNRGEIVIEGSVVAVRETTKIGIAFLKIYEENGDYVTTIIGNEENGLISTNGGRSYSCSYTYEDAIPGVGYYAVVTAYAGDINGFDTQEETTSVAWAPY